MHIKTLTRGLVPVLALFSVQALAIPFNSIDPRSFAMGGAGVAAGTSANASFMNPALLAVAAEDEDFSLEAPILGGRLYDPNDVLDEIDAYQDQNFEGNLTAAIETFKASPSDPNAAAVANAAGALWNQLSKLSNKALQSEFTGGLLVGIPSRKFGVSLVADARVIVGGLLNISAADQALMDGIVADGNTSAVALASNTAVNDQITGTQDVVAKLTSSLEARGLVLGEVGISIAREFGSVGNKFAVGITPKHVSVTTFDYSVDLNTASFDADQGKKEYTNFNIDMGLAKDFGNGWKIGLVGKDLIGQEYKTALNNVVKVEPQFRMGVAHSNEWVSVALDVDLTENEPAGYESKTQYVSVGAELDIFDTIQLRIGYKENLSDEKTSAPTVGLGLSPFGIHLDVAASANDNEIGVALQTGFRF